ncbi:hypothetical protein GEMRC1_006565 [Eukaryota sp. GEM-RC1]
MVKKRNLTTAAPKKGVTNRRQPMPTESSVDEEDFVSELSSHESPSSNVDGSSLASSEAGETTGIRPLGSTESGGNPGPLESSIGPEQEDPLGIKKVLEKYGVPVVSSDTTSTPGDNVVGNTTSSVVQPTSLPSHHVSDSSLLVSSLLHKDNVDPSVPLSREVEESLRQLQTVLAQHKTRAEEAKRQLLEQQQKTANLSMTERALAVEQQTGYVSRPHRDAVPNDLIPFVSPYDQSVSISDYDLWHLAKFAPWHPTLRHRMPAGRHYLLNNVPPGTSPQAIKQFLGDLYDSRAGDTYRFPSTYSWDPRHGIIIEPLVQIFSADGQSVSYEFSAWYLHSLNNKRKLYHNVSVSTEWLLLVISIVIYLRRQEFWIVCQLHHKMLTLSLFNLFLELVVPNWYSRYTGPYLVVSIDSNQINESDLPADHDLHRAIASGDSEEHIVVKILDRFNTPDGEHCTVLCFGGDTSSVPTKDIKNTKAYSEFVKLENVDLFWNSRNVAKSKPTKLKRTSSSMSIPKSSSVVKSPVAKRTRSSRREKR